MPAARGTALKTDQIVAELARSVAARLSAASPARLVGAQAAEWNELLISVVRSTLGAAIDHGALAAISDKAALSLLPTIEQAVKSARRVISDREIDALVELLLGAHDPVAAVGAAIDADNAEARIRFIERVACLSSAEIAERVGHGAKNKSQTASRWKAEGRVFSVPWRGRELYPAFQFLDGRPRLEIAETLAALPTDLSPWQLAFWFVSSNPRLDGAAPRDRLSESKALVSAAREEGDAVVG